MRGEILQSRPLNTPLQVYIPFSSGQCRELTFFELTFHRLLLTQHLLGVPFCAELYRPIAQRLETHKIMHINCHVQPCKDKISNYSEFGVYSYISLFTYAWFIFPRNGYAIVIMTLSLVPHCITVCYVVYLAMISNYKGKEFASMDQASHSLIHRRGRKKWIWLVDMVTVWH